MTPRLLKHLVWATVSLVFGLFLIYFGNHRGLFAGDGRWFAVTTLAFAWVITLVLLGRYFRDNPPAGR